jgi:hypothetical protein
MGSLRAHRSFASLTLAIASFGKALAWKGICATILSLFLLSGAARAVAPIPIRLINTNAGRVWTAHVDEYDHRIYIGGLVFRPSSPGIGAHVHVWGVNRRNHQVFFKTTYVMITGRPCLNRSESYVVSLSPCLFDKATLIYVTFHSQSDAESKHEDYD